MKRNLLIAGAVIWVWPAWVAAAEPAAKRREAASPPNSAYALPHNYFGAHLLVGDGREGSRGDKHLRWARYLVGRWGLAKTLVMGVDQRTRGPQGGWVDYVNRCYEIELVPFIRLGGNMRNNQWVAPQADAPLDYKSMAAAVKSVVAGLPRSDLCPLYIELWNEPNLSVEWTGKPNAEEYAAFFVQVARAVHEIGDDRIKVLNGGLATSPEWTRKLCEHQPDFIRLFDVWSCHPYPMNRPPSSNHHDKTIPPESDLAIDAYLLELAELKKLGRDNVKVVITETGYDLGNSVYQQGEGHPIIDEFNRADYMVRAFRDYYPKWPEVHAVTPFEFSNEGWERFDWVYPDSDVNPNGSPTRPHYQYTAVAALAKPTDETGAISGTVTVAGLGTRLEGAEAAIRGQAFTSDPMGNYFLARLRPGEHRVRVAEEGFRPQEKKLEVVKGQNTVWDIELEATRRTVLGGTVCSGDTGKPLEGVHVELKPGGGSATTDHKGHYEFKETIPSRYTLVSSAEGQHAYTAQSLVVELRRDNRHDFVLGERRCPAEKNMTNNSSMEAGGGGGAKPGIALGFEPLALDNYRDNLLQVSDAEAHTGRVSQMMRLRKQETAIRQITHYGTAKPGTTYTGSAWIKVDGPAREDAAWITLDATDNGGGVMARFEPKAKIEGRSRGWVWVSVEGVAPEKSQRLSLNLHTQGSGGLAYFDDVYIGPK